MNNMLKIFGGGVDKIIDSVGETLDRLITNDEERGVLANELEEIRLAAKQDVGDQVLSLEKEITSRWNTDKEHFVTRAIRPLTVFWVYFIFTVVILFDGNIGEFSINSAYIPLLETILVTVTIAYFGSRGIEKTTKIAKNSDMSLF